MMHRALPKSMRRLVPILGLMLALATLACSFVLTEPNSTTLIVVNNTSQAICHIYAVPNNQADWGTDHLGGQPIDIGQQHTLTSLAPGVYNLRAEACTGGAYAERYDTE